MSQFYASILVLIFALAGAAHGFCAHGIGGIGEYIAINVLIGKKITHCIGGQLRETNLCRVVK